jgi:peptidyl-dipeptidase Dcp
MTNPLLKPSPLKNAAVPFNELKAEHFAPALDEAIRIGRERLAEIKRRNASFDHTLRGLEACTEEIEFVFTLFNNLLVAHGDESLQSLSMELGPKVAAFSNDILLDADVFARVREVYDQRGQLALNAEQIRLVEKVYRDFERSGAGLSEDKKARLRAIDERWSQLSPKFRENVLKSTNTFELWIDDEKDLAGLPATVRTTARESAAEKGQPERWLFTLHYPSYQPFLKYADNRTLREQMWRAFNSRALDSQYDNRPVIREIVALAQEKAQLLGSKSYAHYALQLRMAETPEHVLQFLERLYGASFATAQKEVAEVATLARDLGGPATLMPWDFAYYSEKLKERRYTFDEETLRPYFKLENVLAGVFEHAHRLFGLTFTESDEYPVYHEDVRVFEVYKDAPEKEFVGLFYADFFPRATKSQGAWMTNFYEQGVFRGRRIRPHVSIVCNFTKPTAEQPSLLGFDEVSTLFHEFGHALHSLLSQVEFRSLAGTNVYLDFVELPSQIFENWAEEEESLKLFAHHYRTGALIPMDLVEKLKRAQKFQVGYLSVRQLNFAFLDMAWFLNPPGIDESVEHFEDRITARCRVLPKIDGTNISTSFAHIFGGGYSSGYYSYKWAEALDADAFELFRERGIFDPESARRFEEFVLSKGGSEHPMRLYEQFRGRAPDPEALLRRDGLLS